MGIFDKDIEGKLSTGIPGAIEQPAPPEDPVKKRNARNRKNARMSLFMRIR